jgi:formyl-CoA transferase
VPSQTVQTLSEVVEDPQVVARRAISETAHPLAGTVRAVGSPWRLGADGAERKHRPAPVLGADTVEVLREAGYADEEVDELLKGGAAWASATRTP